MVLHSVRSAQPVSTPPIHSFQSRQRWYQRVRRSIAAIATSAIAVTAIAGAGWSADPFRTDAPRNIDAGTEAAFNALFQDGDYRAAREALQSADESEPLSHAMKAAFAYLSEDWDAMAEQATKTRTTAEAMLETDPLRGNIYVAAGHFLEGAHAFVTQGAVRGTPVALSKLQRVFNHLDEAERIDLNDPELNLLRGYMDLMLAVNLPFSDPNDAIARLENYASPAYLAQRGIAVGYRDLGQQDKAMTAINRALELAPDNPELHYLKAQILVRQNNYPESLQYFATAIEKLNQLPYATARQLAWEYCRAQRNVDGQARDCDAERDQIVSEF
ncbi:MAG: Sll0314/Alr1548 family TPR repeat-containing protein [Thainema sp.]